MIFIETEDGLIGPIKNWRPIIISEKKICKMILTDGHGFKRELSGFQYYSIEIEATTGVANGIVRETIYGIIDTFEQEKKLLDLYNEKLKRIPEDDNYEFNIKRLERRYKDLLKLLKQKQVTSYSLIIDTIPKNFEIDETNIKIQDLKNGIYTPPSLFELLGNSIKKM